MRRVLVDEVVVCCPRSIADRAGDATGAGSASPYQSPTSSATYARPPSGEFGSIGVERRRRAPQPSRCSSCVLDFTSREACCAGSPCSRSPRAIRLVRGGPVLFRISSAASLAHRRFLSGARCTSTPRIAVRSGRPPSMTCPAGLKIRHRPRVHARSGVAARLRSRAARSFGTWSVGR